MSGWVGDVELEEIIMEIQGVLPKQINLSWKIVNGINSAILIIFWFGVLTDYSWNVWWLNIVFPVLTGVVSFLTLLTLRHLGKVWRWVISLACVLSILVSGLCVLFFLPDLFFPSLSTHRDGLLLQKENSPDGARIVEAYCFTQSAHGGTDRISIRIRYKSLPFVKRDVAFYYNYPSQACKYSGNQIVAWKNDSTLLVVDRQVELAVGLIDWADQLYNDGATNGVY